MTAWQWLLVAAVALLVVVVGYGTALAARGGYRARLGATFVLTSRPRTACPGRGWILGIGRYSGDDLEWFRIFSLTPRPRRVWRRATLSYDGRREPVGAETMSLFADHVIAQCTTPAGPVEVAMSVEALTGFLAWLEAAPPGTDWDRPRRG